MVGVVAEGPTASTELTGRHLLALGYLAVTVTAIAFVLWYSAVSRIGADRAGLLTGVAPASAALTGVILGEPLPSCLSGSASGSWRSGWPPVCGFGDRGPPWGQGDPTGTLGRPDGLITSTIAVTACSMSANAAA